MDAGGAQRGQNGSRLLFRRAQRLTLPGEFALALRARPIAVSPHFQVFRPKVTGLARLGVVVGKRFVKKAVDRNAVKRLIRELFRTRRFELAQSDVVVRVRSPIPHAGRSETRLQLRAELAKLLGIDQPVA